MMFVGLIGFDWAGLIGLIGLDPGLGVLDWVARLHCIYRIGLN